MQNIVINTDEVSDDDYWENCESVYCTNCRSCGDFGCKCWSGCSVLYCKYGDDLIKEVSRIEEDCSMFYDMLVELGIGNPFQVDLDRIKLISKSDLPLFKKRPTVKEIIQYYYYQVKDVEEE